MNKEKCFNMIPLCSKAYKPDGADLMSILTSTGVQVSSIEERFKGSFTLMIDETSPIR